MTLEQKKEGVADSGNRDKGDPQSLTREEISALVAKEYAGLTSLIRRKLRDRELAEDLVNEAIAITLEHARSGRVASLERVGGYIFQVSMNLLRNHRRNSGNRGDLRTDAEILENIGHADHDEMESAQISEKARRLIEELKSPRDREVVKRFYLDEESKESICQAMSLTSLQFTQVMSRARQRLKAIFDTQGLKRHDFLSLL